MIIKPCDELIRYTGRWRVDENEAISTANGNYLEFCFKGDNALISYNIDDCQRPFPHVYIRVDGGAYVETAIDRYLRISAEYGVHKVELVLKSSLELQSRWAEPLVSKVGVLGIEAEDSLPLPEDKRPIIEFIGDSITEGTMTDTQYRYYGTKDDLVYMNDSVAGYPWQTAKALDMRLVTMGYGCLGVTKGGAGGIPPAEEAYPFYSEGYPMPSQNADIIVINHGSNDMKAERELYRNAYESFLDSVRERNRESLIFCIAPFVGVLSKEVSEAVESHNKRTGDRVVYVDTTDWIPPRPLHPLREACVDIGKRLAKIIEEEYNKLSIQRY